MVQPVDRSNARRYPQPWIGDPGICRALDFREGTGKAFPEPLIESLLRNVNGVEGSEVRWFRLLERIEVFDIVCAELVR